MKSPYWKTKARRFYQKTFDRASAKCNEDDLRRKAIVFSPHFDDETLGCGGTIIRKVQANASVAIVFMTDGSKSHTHLISEAESRTIRRAEGRAAAEAMGIGADDVFLLDFDETKLIEHVEPALARVQEILMDRRPDDVFIPYHKEPLLWSADHLATTKIVKAALKAVGRATRVYEYPVWFWCHWPWAPLPLRRRRDIVKHTVNHGFLPGANLVRHFKYGVPISDLWDHKRRVLQEHRSQMTQLIPNVGWRTLGDVAHGEFLDCFFHSCELFHAYEYPTGQR